MPPSPPGHRVHPAGPIAALVAAAPRRELARASGVSERALRRLANGHTHVVRETTADRLAAALGRHLGEIYPDEPVHQHHARGTHPNTEGGSR